MKTVPVQGKFFEFVVKVNEIDLFLVLFKGLYILGKKNILCVFIENVDFIDSYVKPLPF